jgi:hypothetical protein
MLGHHRPRGVGFAATTGSGDTANTGSRTGHDPLAIPLGPVGGRRPTEDNDDQLPR